MLAAIGLAGAGFFGLCTVVVIGCFPGWVRNAADGDLAGLGLLAGETL